MNTHHPQDVIPNVWLKVVTEESRNFLEPHYGGDILDRVLKLIISIVSILKKFLGTSCTPPVPFFCH
jgi:hypothetical protein